LEFSIAKAIVELQVVNIFHENSAGKGITLKIKFFD